MAWLEHPLSGTKDVWAMVHMIMRPCINILGLRSSRKEQDCLGIKQFDEGSSLGDGGITSQDDECLLHGSLTWFADPPLPSLGYITPAA